jgi:hypothetical protein
MEIKEFEQSRNSRLVEFNKKYAYLKREYSSTVSAAIQEKDPNNQQELVQRALTINADLSNEIRSILSEIYKGSEVVPTKTMDELTEDLIRYQKQYSEIEKGKDRLQTLKLINITNDKKLSDTNLMYNIYIGLLVFLVFIVGYLVFRTNVSNVFNKVASTLPSAQQT